MDACMHARVQNWREVARSVLEQPIRVLILRLALAELAVGHAVVAARLELVGCIKPLLERLLTDRRDALRVEERVLQVLRVPAQRQSGREAER